MYSYLSLSDVENVRDGRRDAGVAGIGRAWRTETTGDEVAEEKDAAATSLATEDVAQALASALQTTAEDGRRRER